MAEKKYNLKPDVVQKDYWRQKETFADLFNASIFDGREVIKPQNLVDSDTETSAVVTLDDADMTMEGARDNLKTAMRCDGVEYAIFGIDDQNFIHYAMPMQVEKYDFVAYQRQVQKLRKHYRDTNELKGNERMSGMKKTDKFTPVVTVVVYFGSEPWDGPKSLHEMLNLPEELKPYVNDVKINLVEARDNNLVFHNRDNQDLFALLKIIYDGNASRPEKRQQLEQYSAERKIDQTVLKVIASTTKVKLDVFEDEEEVTVCRLWDEVKEEGKAEEIVSTGMEFGMTREEVLSRLERKLGIDGQQALRYYEQFSQQEIAVDSGI